MLEFKLLQRSVTPYVLAETYRVSNKNVLFCNLGVEKSTLEIETVRFTEISVTYYLYSQDKGSS